MQNIVYSDNINDLPVSNSHLPTNNEIQIMNSLFKEKEGINNIITDFKDSIVLGIFFAVLASPLINKAIYRLPIPRSFGYILTIKTVIFILVAWVYQNKYFSKNNF